MKRLSGREVGVQLLFQEAADMAKTGKAETDGEGQGVDLYFRSSDLKLMAK